MKEVIFMAWEDPISDAQLVTIKGLCGSKDLSSLPQAQREFLVPVPFSIDKQEYNLRRMNRAQAHEAINLILQLPKLQAPPRVTDPLPPVPVFGDSAAVDKSQQEIKHLAREGYFFIVDPTDGKEKFFHVKHGREDTKWKGYTFLEVQASDFLYPVKDKDHREAVFAEINKDPIKAMNEYGIRIGRCGVCGRTLTDRDSRLRGIGPICAAKLGPTQEQMDILNRLGLIKQRSEDSDTGEDE